MVNELELAAVHRTISFHQSQWLEPHTLMKIELQVKQVQMELFQVDEQCGLLQGDRDCPKAPRRKAGVHHREV